MAKEIINRLLNMADITINGNNPWDIKVYNDKFYKRILNEQTLGLGESYMEEWWDTPAVDQFIYKILDAKLYLHFKNNIPLMLNLLYSKVINKQSPSRAKQVASTHYNLSYDLFQNMLGPTLSYTCGYFKKTDNLETAQNQKHDLICKKLQLSANDHVLEMGCGWGSFAEYATKHYGCKITSLNISDEQIKYAKKYRSNSNTTFYCCDWREHTQYNPNQITFDKIVSIGMAEHVGYKNYKLWMQLVNQQLKNHGLFLLHSIGSNVSTTTTDQWIAKYIFPNGMLPSLKQLNSAMENYFILEDLHNFGAYYDKTLMSWHKNFKASWPEIKSNYTQEFYRMWEYYLLSCAGMFRARDGQLWQLVLSKNGIPGGYESIR